MVAQKWKYRVRVDVSDTGSTSYDIESAYAKLHKVASAMQEAGIEGDVTIVMEFS